MGADLDHTGAPPASIRATRYILLADTQGADTPAKPSAAQKQTLVDHRAYRLVLTAWNTFAV